MFKQKLLSSCGTHSTCPPLYWSSFSCLNWALWMSGEDVGGSRLSVCKLSALGQSCQFRATLDWYFTFIGQTEIGIKEHRCTHGQANDLHKKVTWTTLILSVSDGNSYPMSSFAILCLGIRLCSHTRELVWGSKIVYTASYFTYWLFIVFRVNTGRKYTKKWFLDTTIELMLCYCSVPLSFLGLVCHAFILLSLSIS